jgi:hypothetical protein
MAQPMVNVPRRLGNPSRVRLMSAASATPEKHEDSAVSVQVDEGKRGGSRAMQRRLRRGVLDVSPFGMQIYCQILELCSALYSLKEINCQLIFVVHVTNKLF